MTIKKNKSISGIDGRILEVVKIGKRLDINSILGRLEIRGLNVSRGTVEAHVKYLARTGYLMREGSRPNPYKYALPEVRGEVR